MNQVRFGFCLSGLLLFAIGCGGPKAPERVPTVPVKGVITIDGQPTQFVKLYLYPADNLPDYVDRLIGTAQTAESGKDGSFSFSTYDAGDGVPAGDYVIAFYWPGNPEVPIGAIIDELPVDPVAADFNSKYGNPIKSEFKVKVEAGSAPIDMGTLNLTTR